MQPWNIGNPGIFGILAYSKPVACAEPWYIQNLVYSEPEAYSFLGYNKNSGIFRTRRMFRSLAYSELDAYSDPVFFQNSSIFRTRSICRILSNSYIELKRFAKIVNGSNYFPNNHSRNIIFSHSLLYEINIINFVNTGLFFFQKYLFYVTKYRSRGWGDEFCVLFLIYPFKVLQWL